MNITIGGIAECASPRDVRIRFLTNEMSMIG